MKILEKNSAWFKKYDISGKKFNKLTVLKFMYFKPLYDKGGKRRSFFLCKCDCGKEIVLPAIKIKNGNNKSCGCINTPKYEIDENFFEQIDSESKAYFLGFLYTDGSVSSDESQNKRVTMQLNVKDIKILEKFRKELKTLKPIYTKKRKDRVYKNYKVKESTSSTINISNVKIRNDLIKLGMVPNKTKTMTFPNYKKLPERFVRHFIRGVFDGDGTIAKSNTSVTLNITSGSERFIQGMSKCLLEKFKIDNAVISYRRKSKFNQEKEHIYWVLSIKAKNSRIKSKKSGKNHRLFFDLIYENCSKELFLERKFKKFKKIYSL